ncbi:DUF5947 family protein [Paractinoplanes toevensis]|uniref:Uncharacterized protein n=1 Tax=Paractinoplanes toevensis TaxID=571911 RepID=A0A919W3D7_9ACTN|nr:DUF5947 family protein [Actinoplanes toevensis]GIM94652.1 hypothetical protein Ato02nite_064450 [Actinoplanes toevensis]
MTGSPLDTLRRIARAPRPPAVERCGMCATQVAPEHSHVVDLQSRQLLCACRACYLLFTDDHAHLRYRAVPGRYLGFDGPVLEERDWDELQIPVGLAFLFHNSSLERMVAFYPGPAGATESELDLPAWERIAARHPALATMRPDVEALLVRRGKDGYLVPIDACYELVGRLRTLWRGFDGGQEAHAAISAFFDEVRSR